VCCDGELQQQSQYSPGVVLHEEDVAYVVLEPEHWSEGNLTLAAFAKSKLEEGLSVYRPAHCTALAAHGHIVSGALARDPSKSLVGCLATTCSEIRDLSVLGERSICVIDDGEAAFPAHASLTFSQAIRIATKSIKVAARGDLVLAFTRRGPPIALVGQSD
jgi:hypothetical protein